MNNLAVRMYKIPIVCSSARPVIFPRRSRLFQVRRCGALPWLCVDVSREDYVTRTLGSLRSADRPFQPPPTFPPPAFHNLVYESILVVHLWHLRLPVASHGGAWIPARTRSPPARLG